MRGWCFGADGKSIRGIRLRANAVKLDGVIGLPRPDVKAAMTDAPDNATGFEIRGTLPSGRVALVLEVLPAVGDWQPLLSRGVEVERQLIPFWLGGGAWTDLMFFQMPAHMAHPPRPVRVEKFPLAPARPGWPR